MAVADIACGRAGVKSVIGGFGLPVLIGAGVSSQKLDATSSNQESTVVAPDKRAVWVITATSGDIYVAFGSAPNALTGTASRHRIVSGTTRDFGVANVGEKVAVVNA
jgi:hypothetical protein